MESLFALHVNVHVIDSLSVIGVFFLYMLFARAFLGIKQDMGLFFLFGGIAWFLNFFYLVIEDLIRPQVGISDETKFLIIGLVNTVSIFFLLLATRERFKFKFPRLFSHWLLISVALLVLVLVVITSIWFPNYLRLGEIFATLFSGYGIFYFGRAYQSFFWRTRRRFSPLAKYCLVFSMYCYAILQMGYFVDEQYHEYFFVAGTGLKLLHILGLILFSQSLFTDYEEKRLVYRKSRDSAKLVDQLAHELHTSAKEVHFRISALEDKRWTSTEIESQLGDLRNLVEQITSLIEGFRILQPSDEPEKVETIPGTCNINQICDSAIMSLKLVMKPKIKFKKEYCVSPTVHGVSSKLLQVFKNIFKNSIEATENQTGGGVFLTTRIIRDSENRPAKVSVKIEDTGQGISETNLLKIFADGFTTKAGRGRGHGLYITKRIVDEHKGEICVKPRGIRKTYPGACFEIVFPYFKE